MIQMTAKAVGLSIEQNGRTYVTFQVEEAPVGWDKFRFPMATLPPKLGQRFTLTLEEIVDEPQGE